MDEGLAEPTAEITSIDLESIDGTADNDIYVVGKKGLMAHWNGQTWTRLSPLTNSYLSRVRCYTKEKVYMVGDKGMFIEYNGREWKAQQLTGCE